MRIRGAVAIGLFVVSAGLPERAVVGAAQGVTTADYLALLDRYRSVDARGAVQALSDLDDRSVEAAVNAVMRSAESWSGARVEAAALLHTEVVTGGWVLPQHVPTHLGAARRFVELGRGRIVAPEFRGRWLLAVCWHYQSEMELGALVPWLDELRERYPDDPDTLLAAGIFYETLIWTDAPPADFTWNTRSKTLAALPNRRRIQALGAAAAQYRRAMSGASTRDAATVRLGRVLAESGHPAEARTLLSKASVDAAERRWRYLAALFLARAESLAGRSLEEAAAYERAAALMPGCQTPLVGLTALRRLEGLTPAASQLAEVLTRDSMGCDDPWWFYRFGQPPDRLPELIAALRGRLLR